MQALQQVTFRFGDDLVVRYLPHPPKHGESLKHGDRLWVVTSVATDDVGAVVRCARADETGSLQPANGYTGD